MTDKLEVVCPKADTCEEIKGCRQGCNHCKPHPYDKFICSEWAWANIECPNCLPTSCVIVTEERPA